MKKFIFLSLFIASLFSYAQTNHSAALVYMFYSDQTCSLGNEYMYIEIPNNGTESISNFQVSYQLRQTQPVVNEMVTDIILPGDLTYFGFANPLNLSTTIDTIFSLKVWINHPGDPDQSDDTIARQVISNVSPAPPTDTSFCVHQGDLIFLSASSPYMIQWYHSPSGNAFASGSTITSIAQSHPSFFFLDATAPNGCKSSMVCDTITTCPPPFTDCTIASLLSPVSGSGATSGIVVSCLVKNIGYVDASNFNLNYTINNSAVVTEH